MGDKGIRKYMQEIKRQVEEHGVKYGHMHLYGEKDYKNIDSSQEEWVVSYYRNERPSHLVLEDLENILVQNNYKDVIELIKMLKVPVKRVVQ